MVCTMHEELAIQSRKIADNIRKYGWHCLFVARRGLRWAPQESTMSEHRIFTTPFASVYPLYVQKAERKGRTKDEVDQVIRWLTGYDQPGLERAVREQCDFRAFFEQAPGMNPDAAGIKGVVCGVRVEDVQDPLMQKIRYLDKLVDELAKGRPMHKVLRSS